jgi:peptidoglycan-associated lipoprotein
MSINFRNYFVLGAVIVLLSAGMSACAKKTVTAVDPVEVVKIEEASGAEVDAGKRGVVNEAMGSPESLDTEIMVAAGSDDEPLEGRTSPNLFPLYFDFDKSLIRSDQIENMEKNGAFMKSNAGVKVRIEGNCDELGTNEYNMALGQRRALSAKKYLVNLGVAETRLDTISYGEERPINFGHDELSWSQNRRDDFVIIK